MPERGRHHPRSDVYADDRHPYYEGRSPHHGRDRGRGDRAEDQRDTANDRRDRHGRQRDTTGTSHNQPPPLRDHQHGGPSRPLRETPPHHPEREYYEEPKPQLYNFRYALTTRGLCQLMELFVNLLIVICAGVPHSNNGGYRDLASLGGIYHYHFGGANAFTGADADRVKELDRLFHQLKRPPYTFAMVCGGILMIYACVTFALGIFRVPFRYPPTLLVEAVLNFLIGLGYIPALAFYLIKVQETYNNPICIEREQMYKSKGHKGFECQYHGADIAGALFAVLAVFVFIFGGVLAIRAFRSVRELKKPQTEENNF